MTVNSSNFNNILRAISAYSDAARADKSLILSTGLTGSDARVTDSGEGFTGTIRWLNYNEPAAAAKPKAGIQTGETSFAAASALGAFMTAGNQSEAYIKNTDAVAAQEQSVQSLISKVDGLAYLGRQFGAVRARREDANFRAILTGVANAIWASNDEDNNGSAAVHVTPTAIPASGDGTLIGPQTTTGAANNKFGWVTPVVDGSGADADYRAATTNAVSQSVLFANESTNANRSSFFDYLLDAMSATSGEFEEPFYYLVISPATFNVLRKQNVLDVNPIQDGNLSVNTLLGGKIRLIVSGNGQADTVSDGTTGTALVYKVSYLIKSGAVHYSNMAINNPTAMDNNPLNNSGFGDVSIVSRWGNILHPAGYSWSGNVDRFPTNGDLDNATSWTQRATNVNQTGIFPIFHG